MAGVRPKMAACFALIFRPLEFLRRRAGFAMILRLSVIAIRYPFFVAARAIRRALVNSLPRYLTIVEGFNKTTLKVPCVPTVVGLLMTTAFVLVSVTRKIG